MKSTTAKSYKKANEMLKSGEFREVVLDFNISADEFFELADRWAERGAKIKKEDGSFVIKLAK
ncbi:MULTISPECIES: hypothetical protein [unclassified Pantoea]|jgi:hypothetical protein|uniref:hypothetical protein n=1 Tax=unclassified Pantoea TaxID=2630326 RepID=UPI001CD4F7C6|nr:MULTISPECIES: hypothetical protein [unclassified Pantoea]MCA1177293.1 hypothetical protein [Pantoea sp. alder69]MCA1249801.1 hypothetical protein [Pantoea sp. alder70]MCA1265782.1 hypothetical protein [Pantoea sp. alder81]